MSTTIADLCTKASQALANPGEPLLNLDETGDLTPVAQLINELINHNRQLTAENQNASTYIRNKVNQLLTVMGTLPLQPEELDDKSLILSDPIGIVAKSFAQILDHLHHTNNKLELARDEIQAIFEAVGGGVMVVDRHGRILSYNQRFHEMFATGEKDILGKQCREVLCQSQQPLLSRCPHQAMLTSGKTEFIPECYINNHNLTIVASPVKDKNGEITRSVILYTDISMLKAAQNELATEKERLRITLQSIAEGVITTDIEGRIILVNAVAEQLTGWSQEMARGKKVCEIFWLVTDQNRQECINITTETLKNKNLSLDKLSDSILIHQDGSERWISLNATTLQAKDGATSGIVVAFRDITTEKEMESEIQKARKIESLGVLAGGLAHDFNNILTGIIGNINLATMLSPPDSPATEKLSQAEKACHRAQSLTLQLLTFAKGGAPIRKTTSVAELIKETAEFSLRGSNVTCGLHLDPDLWMAYIDEGQISQVINNMVINANQAMAGGGDITITARNIEVTADTTLPIKAGKYITLTISDTGCGIEPELMDRIFDPYFTTKDTGSGLGLASCYAIVKKHDGHIAVHSTIGRGTTFTVYLPARTQRPPAPLTAKPSPPVALQPLKILVMDDELMIRELTQAMLTQLGCQVVDTAVDGKEAINLYRHAIEQNAPYDLVLLDLTIPGGMGGKETMEQLRQIDPDVKAIVSSGYSSDASMTSYQQYGFKAVIPKPYQLQQFISTIQSVASGAEVTKEE
ncbi:MAG: PAS domain S-box protein [Proteobacteria bacterium]|nr:PAS domain S-box protein [Desulfobulbaceae bacterium]MBU4151864.1 PAS domain S-box protein [Pseudomonadota bacterium]